MSRLTASALAVPMLAGCASFSPDGGFDTVDQLAKDRIGRSPSYQRSTEQADAAHARVAELLRQPPTADTAVEIALLNNRDLQSGYAELGIAESDLVRAGRLANPSISFGRLSGRGVVEIDRAVLFDMLGLFTMPLARQVEQRRFEQAQLQAAYETVGVATEARTAFFEAVAAEQLVGYFGQVKEAAETSNELARRMVAAGNFSKRAQMGEQSFYSDATMQLGRARHQAVAARDRGHGEVARALAVHAPHQCAARGLPEQERDRRATQQRLRDRAGAAAVRRRLRSGGARRGHLPAVVAPHGRRGREGALRGARELLGLSNGLRPGEALPGRGGAAAPAFSHGDAAHAKPRAYDRTQVEDTAFGREGDPKKVTRTIQLDMSDAMRFSAAKLTVKRGETIRFLVHNSGQLLHEMVLGTPEALAEHAELMKRFPNMEHADPNMAHVKPGATGQIVWQFTQAGRFQFACLQAGHFEAGMVGAIAVN